MVLYQNIKYFKKIRNRTLSSRLISAQFQKMPEITTLNLISGIKHFPEIGFWYLSLTSKIQPSVEKRKVAKKLKFLAKIYFLQSTLTEQKTIFEFFWKIRDVFIPLKEETDLLKSKPNTSKKTYLKLRNCTTSDDTNQLLLQTNVYIDNVHLFVKVDQNEAYDFEYLFQIYSFPIDKFFVKKS